MNDKLQATLFLAIRAGVSIYILLWFVSYIVITDQNLGAIFVVCVFLAVLIYWMLDEAQRWLDMINKDENND